MRVGAHIFKISDTCQPNLFFGVLDQISDPAVEYTFNRLVEFQLVDRVGIDRFDFAVEALEDRDALADLLQREQARFVTIVEVGCTVGDFIGDIDELSFERRTKVEQILGEFGKLFGNVIVGMFDDAFANFEGQVESAESGVAQLEVFYDAQRVQVVVKK